MSNLVFYKPSVSTLGINAIEFRWRIRKSFKRSTAGEKLRFLVLSNGRRYDVGETTDLDSGIIKITIEDKIDTMVQFFGMIIYESNTHGSIQSDLLTAGTANGHKTDLIVTRTMDAYFKSWSRAGFISDGLLYVKKKKGDEVCNYCLDSLSHINVDGSCPVCFGTGYVGGYYTYNVKMRVAKELEGNTEESISKFSADDTVDSVTLECTGNVMHLCTSGALWKEKRTGLLYRILKTQVSKAIAGFPVKIVVVASRLSRNSVEYNIGGEGVERLD